MSGGSFRSVGMVAAVAGAALGCYLVSLRVASERAALEQVETRIVLAQRDIRLLQTEIGTRGRLAQLERWNVKVLALSAPQADQFLDGGFALAKLITPRREIDLQAPVVLASAPDDRAANGAAKVINADYRPGEPEPSEPIGEMLHQASLKQPARVAAVALPAATTVKPATPAKLASRVAKPNNNDPLAPLPTSQAAASRSTAKESGAAR